MSVSVDAWDASEYLDSEEAIAAYLNAVIEEEDPALLQAALGDVAKARGMTEIAKSAGVGRERLYKSLSATGTRPSRLIHKVLGSLGLKMELVPVEA